MFDNEVVVHLAHGYPKRHDNAFATTLASGWLEVTFVIDGKTHARLYSPNAVTHVEVNPK